jgi:hypothetical protein
MQAKCRGSGSYLEACVQRCLQRQIAWGTSSSFVAQIFSITRSMEVVEDLQVTVEGFDELLIWLDPHDHFWKHVMPA